MRLAYLLVSLALASVRGEPVRFDVIVPAPAASIGEVRLAGKVCRIVRMRPASEARAIVVANAMAAAEPEAMLFAELRAAMPALSKAKIEAWVNGGSGKWMAAGRFPPGWAAALLDAPDDDAARPPYQPIEELLSLVARRFRSEGAVRVIWLDSLFAFGARPEVWTLMDRAGVALYPILVPMNAGLSGVDQRTLERFGAAIRPMAGWPGQTLARALADSEQGTVVTVEAERPRNSAPLQVVGKDGRVLFQRRISVGATFGPEAEVTRGDMAQRSIRLVRRLGETRVSVSPSCGNAGPTDGNAFVRLEGIPAAVSADERVFVQERRQGLARRPEPMSMRTDGDGYCLGPFEVGTDGVRVIYSFDGDWVEWFRLGPIQQ